MRVMAAPSPSHWPKTVVRLVAAGIGATVAGPLGASLGGMLGGVLSDHAGVLSERAAELIQEYVEKGGDKLSEFGVHYCYEQFRDLHGHPPLEAVLREALREAL